MRCKVGDLVYCHGFGVRTDPYGNRGHVGQIVGVGQTRDWSVLIPGKPAHRGDGTWGADDSWLTPIRGDLAEDEVSIPRKEPVAEQTR
jgi:hypothetical protein